MTTQSEADARRSAERTANHDAQLKTLQSAYNPDALHRTLDWIGNLFGSGHSYAPSGGSRAIDWIARQFGDPTRMGGSENPINYGSYKDPWGDQTGPAAEAWYRNVAASPTPFGDVQYGPPAPAPKPVTKISSAPDLHKIVQSALGGPSEPYHPLTPLPGYGSPPQQQAGPAGYNPEQNMGPLPPQDAPPVTGGPAGYNPEQNMGPLPPQNAPVDMRSPPGAGPRPPEFNLGSLPAQNPSLWDRITSKNRVHPPVPGEPVARSNGNSPFTAGPGGSGWNPFSWLDLENGLGEYRNIFSGGARAASGNRARGGPIGLMRGGYPELYGSQGAVRHTFDSGGQNYVNQGDSSGRADDVNAKLSPKEYVMDAESMALLGDGNPDHGAKKMDEMRANLRREKGAALAKGKFSPKAKSAQEYLVGNPMGDGLRRRGKDKG